MGATTTQQAETDGEIVRLLEAGDLEAAATGALRTYGPQVLAYLHLFMRDDEAAHEVFSQFGEDLWTGISQFRGECSVKGWLYKLATHAAHRFFREAYHHHVRRLRTGEASRIAAEIRSSFASYQRVAVRDRLSRIRDQLAPEEQALLMLRVDQGLTWPEIAEILWDPDDPVDALALRKRFSRLRKKLRVLAKAEGL